MYALMTIVKEKMLSCALFTVRMDRISESRIIKITNAFMKSTDEQYFNVCSRMLIILLVTRQEAKRNTKRFMDVVKRTWSWMV